ncbi:MAG: hypothetical protein JNL32_10545 [Candidatus Kapabacteria bacterium]|nr:hypothetical protein [Candidatus Kapabacteria bacterium]
MTTRIILITQMSLRLLLGMQYLFVWSIGLFIVLSTCGCVKAEEQHDIKRMNNSSNVDQSSRKQDDYYYDTTLVLPKEVRIVDVEANDVCHCGKKRLDSISIPNIQNKLIYRCYTYRTVVNKVECTYCCKIICATKEDSDTILNYVARTFFEELKSGELSGEDGKYYERRFSITIDSSSITKDSIDFEVLNSVVYPGAASGMHDYAKYRVPIQEIKYFLKEVVLQRVSTAKYIIESRLN